MRTQWIRLDQLTGFVLTCTCLCTTLSVFAQTVEAVDTKAPKGYEGKSYVYKSGVTLRPGFTVSAQTNGPFFIKYDDFLNSSQTTVYGINSDGSPKEIASSKTYSDGLGTALQGQIRSYTTNKVLASEAIYDSYGQQTLSTLPAPINAQSFLYQHKFTTNAQGQKYHAGDFDAVGTLNNPNAVANGGVGTLGWYYSSSNTLEPLTATTGFPYARSWAEPGPDPKLAKSAGPGENNRMGSGHESVSSQLTFKKSELSHYYSLQSHFSISTVINETNLISSSEGASTTGFQANQSVSISNTYENNQTYVQVSTTQTTSTPGVWPIEGNKSVIPGATYRFRVKGYRVTSTNAYLFVRNANTNTNLVWATTLLPQGASNEAWVETTFTIPSGCNAVSVGVLWSGLTGSYNEFRINALGLSQVLDDSNVTKGYKFMTTDPDGKKVMTFVDADGNTLATALVTNVSGTQPNQTFLYDHWSYAYYNDLGQVVATVAPNGVNTASNAYPSFVTTYKYDHVGQLIETLSPDEGKTQYLYSTDGKIRFSQNELQRAASPQRFSYTNYDYLGRLIEAGEYSTPASGGYVFIPVGSPASPGANTSVTSIADNTGFSGITHTSDPNNYCTDYSYIEYDVAGSNFPSGHPAQNNLYGRVSKTENANASTWYSYDEFGQLEWSVQAISDLGLKTIGYTYDYTGNVTQVAYQAGQSDAYYHFYTYDADQRLKEVYSSTSPGYNTTSDIRARYSYYLHGPLKRMELASGACRQGVDCVYNTDGSLKSINSSDPANDPGQDQLTSTPDFFGETFHYNDNDYTSSGYTASTITLNSGSHPPSYSGNPRAISYHNSTDKNSAGSNVRHLYAYQYDGRNQLTNAQWGSMAGTTPLLGDAEREQVTGYDKNGNIQGLQRTGNVAQNLANYAYLYESNTNKLDKINHNGTPLTDYTYNAIGQMIRQNEGVLKDFKVTYTAYGQVKEVVDYDSLYNIQTYVYDDRGDLVKRTAYRKGVAIKNTFYVRDGSGTAMAIYEQALPGGTPQLTEVPVYGAGRLGMYLKAGNSYLYELSDHLGNVRAVCGQMDPESYFENFEDGQSDFDNYHYYYTNNAMDHTDAGTVYQNVQTINGGTTGRVGIAKSFSVSPGDQVSISAYARYEALTGNANYNALITTLASAFGVSAGSTGESLKIYNGLGDWAGMVPGGDHPGDEEAAPKIFVTIILFDKNYQVVDATFDQVTLSGASAHDLLSASYTVRQPGYAYVFVSNEHPTYVTAHFDDVTVSHTHGPVVAGSDYYPFGLVMDGTEITDEKYRYGYQGQFSEKDLTTGQQEFELRMYDPRIGRWLSPDPYGQYASPYLAMGNVPNMHVDPNGGFSGGCPPNCVTFVEGIGYVGAEFIAVEASRWIPTLTEVMTTAAGAIAAQSAGFIADNRHYYPGGKGLMIEPSYNNSPYPDNYAGDLASFRAPNTSDLTSGISMPSAETIQAIAGAAGWIPGVQTVAGVIEAGAALHAGDYWGAGFAVLGAIPVLGYVAKTAKLARNAHKAIVIGERMSRVKDVGRRIGAKWYQAWGKNFPINGPDELERALRRNKRWIESKIRKGYTIYDAGPVGTNSPFYKLEKEILKIHRYPTIPVQ